MSATGVVRWVISVSGRAVLTGKSAVFSSTPLAWLLNYVTSSGRMSVPGLSGLAAPIGLLVHSRRGGLGALPKMRYYGYTKWSGRAADTSLSAVYSDGDVLTLLF